MKRRANAITIGHLGVAAEANALMFLRRYNSILFWLETMELHQPMACTNKDAIPWLYISENGHDYAYSSATRYKHLIWKKTRPVTYRVNLWLRRLSCPTT